MTKRVLLGMSGGVDSSVAAILLKQQGYEVIGVTMKLYDGEVEGTCCNTESTMDARRVCDFLGIPHYTLNFTHEFHECVIKDFIQTYADCKTPNPCIECNKYLKFGYMYQKAKELDCDYIATGHYAKTEYDKKYGQYVLKKANAGKKDQSYVLYNLPKAMLNKFLLPLGDFHNKDEIRKIALDNNLPVASKPDSEDICFIPDGNYAKFLEDNSNLKPTPGNIVMHDGTIVGRHKGLYNYTIGQRKGIGVTHPTPLYVLGFNKAKNELIVGEENELYKDKMLVNNYNFLIDFDHSKPLEVNVKIRYQSKDNPAKILVIGDKIEVTFDHPVARITPGQSAVFYIDDIVVGGGKII